MTLSARVPILDFRFFVHRITRSALTKTFGATVAPICFAVFESTTNSKFLCPHYPRCSHSMSLHLTPYAFCD